MTCWRLFAREQSRHLTRGLQPPQRSAKRQPLHLASWTLLGGRFRQPSESDVSSSDSLTYQQLPPNLLAPLMDEVITLAEASWLWDLFLLHPDEWFSPPPELEPAVARLKLWQMAIEPTRH